MRASPDWQDGRSAPLRGEAAFALDEDGREVVAETGGKAMQFALVMLCISVVLAVMMGLLMPPLQPQTAAVARPHSASIGRCPRRARLS